MVGRADDKAMVLLALSNAVEQVIPCIGRRQLLGSLHKSSRDARVQKYCWPEIGSDGRKIYVDTEESTW